MSPVHCRRSFLRSTSLSLGALLGADLGCLRQLACAAIDGGAIGVDSRLVRFGPDMDPLVKLIRSTPTDRLIPVFVKQIRSGLSYSRLLAGVFFAAVQTGDLHQIAQVYGAHRISAGGPIETRLLPLFWALDRVHRGHQSLQSEFAVLELSGKVPKAGEAQGLFQNAMRRSRGHDAELAAVALARSQGARQTMMRLWEFAARDLAGSLGHLPIGLANACRALDAIGWNHAEPALRYLAKEIGRFQGDSTYSPNLERVERTVPRLPADWSSADSTRSVTLELYGFIRAGDAAASADFICSRLLAGKAKAGSLWDGVALAAADLLHRYSVGGSAIGGVLVHAVTSTNALRFGFGLVENPRTRLLNLLQAAGYLAAYFVRDSEKNGRLRARNLVDDFAEIKPRKNVDLVEVFRRLPSKGDNREERDTKERAASDAASRLVFGLLRGGERDQEFLQAALGLLCMKASKDPHDIKYPAAAFEEASSVSREWRPYILASTVHALHGPSSADAAVLIQARAALAGKR